MSMLKQVYIDQVFVCLTSNMAAEMKNAIEHHTADHIGRFECRCHKTECMVKILVSQSATKASLTVLLKAVVHVHKSAHFQGAFEQGQKVRLIHFARRQCWYVRCCNTLYAESAFYAQHKPSGRTFC